MHFTWFVYAIISLHLISDTVATNSTSRPGLFRSASSSMKQYLSLWPDELLVCLLKAYVETSGYHEGRYFGRSQMISNSIYEQSGKWRSPAEVKRKLISLDKLL